MPLHAHVALPAAAWRIAAVAIDRDEHAHHQVDETAWNATRRTFAAGTATSTRGITGALGMGAAGIRGRAHDAGATIHGRQFKTIILSIFSDSFFLQSVAARPVGPHGAKRADHPLLHHCGKASQVESQDAGPSGCLEAQHESAKVIETGNVVCAMAYISRHAAGTERTGPPLQRGPCAGLRRARGMPRQAYMSGRPVPDSGLIP